jgi:hypothetical protein
MTRITTTIAILAAGLALTATDAAAQVRLSVAGGPSFPVGHLADEMDTGFNVLLGAGLSVPVLPVGIRVDGMLNQFPESGHDGNFRVISGSVNAILDIPMVVARPYIIGGLGVYNSRFTDDDHDHGDEGSTTNVGANIGAGIRVGLGGISVFAETRLHNIFSEGEQARFIPLSLGIRL